MSQTSPSAAAHPNYVKIWAILVALLVVSVVGPMFGVRLLTLLTAFGIAIVKAYLVARNFMHLDVQPKVVAYLLAACLSLVTLFYFGVAPDVMRHDGSNWVNTAANNPPSAHPAGHEAAHGEH